MLGRRIIAGSRYFLAIAVLGSFLSSVVLIVYGALAVLSITWTTIQGSPTLKSNERSTATDQAAPTDHAAVSNQEVFSVKRVEHLAVEFIQLIDVFLLGTVLYIIALGIYELFLDPGLPVPAWLHITDLDDLKEKLIGVTIVLLGVTFLGEVVTWSGSTSILYLGAAIALVSGSLAATLAITHARRPKDRSTDKH